MNFKAGDIIENRWAGPNNPTKHFMFIKWNNGGIVGLDYYNGFSKCDYSREVVNELCKGEPAFRKVGRSDLIDKLSNPKLLERDEE